MQLVYTPQNQSWDAISSFRERDIPRSAGFQWNPSATRWSTGDVLVAARLREFADQETQAKLDADLVIAKAAAEVAAEQARIAVEASRATDADMEIPCGPERSFLPYQRAGIKYIAGRRCCFVGDDMGLGKTAQAIGALNVDESLKKILIVCPASLTRNWAREIGLFGSRNLTVGITTTKRVPDTDIVICTYDVFSRGTAAADILSDIIWDALILDEAHYLKNDKSMRTKHILGDDKDYLGLRAYKRIYLTGSPVTARPIDLWPLIHSLDHHTWSDRFRFAKRYCGATHNGHGWDFSGSSNLDELQDKLRGTIMLRRLKADVLTELPAKRRQILEMPADSAETRAALKAEAAAEADQERKIAALKADLRASRRDPESYKAAVAALRAAQLVGFTEMSRVRHPVAVSKIPLVVEHKESALEGGGKIIVFAHHRDVMEALERELAEYGVVSITGDTPVGRRQEIVNRFQGDPAVRVFLGNIQVAGTGITLTASAHVVFAELDWTPANVSQAEDRAHRLGQTGSVLIQHLVLEGSLDARMCQVIVQKQEVIDAALNDVESAEDREARIAEPQARIDAVAEAAIVQAKIEAAAAAERAAAEAERIAARKEQASTNKAAYDANRETWARQRAERLQASLDGAALDLSDAQPPSAAAVAIHQGLRRLAELDPDGASEVNGEGFSRVDSYFGHELAARNALGDNEALVGRYLVRRYKRQLPPALVAAALDKAAPTEASAASKETSTVVKGAFSNPRRQLPSVAFQHLQEGGSHEWVADQIQRAAGLELERYLDYEPKRPTATLWLWRAGTEGEEQARSALGIMATEDSEEWTLLDGRQNVIGNCAFNGGLAVAAHMMRAA